MNEKQTALKNSADIVLSSINNSYTLFINGTLTEEQAKDQALNWTRTFRYGALAKDYFWIQETKSNKPYVVMHPNRPDLEGTDVSQLQDTNGKYYFVEFMNVAEASGSGYVEYTFQYYAETDHIAPKLSYVVKYTTWDWIVGTGIYIEDVDTLINNQTMNVLFIVLAVAAVVLVVAILLTRRIANPIIKLKNVSETIATGDLRQKQKITASDELKDLVDSIANMQGKTNSSKFWINWMLRVNAKYRTLSIALDISW